MAGSAKTLTPTALDVSAAEAMICPACSSGRTFVFFGLPDVPVHCNVLCASREQALAVPRANIRLSFCQACELVWNVAFDPAQVVYRNGYENSLDFSPRFRRYAEATASRLIERYHLHGRRIVEIACGKGEFLRLVCSLGNNRGIGFDPSYVPDEHTPQTDAVTFVAAYYPGPNGDQPADLVCCRHALEHIADPVSFLRSISGSATCAAASVFFLEVPNAVFTLREQGIWDILYEHCTYFTPLSLARAFEVAGLSVLDVREEYGGQFLSIEASTRPAGNDTTAGFRQDLAPLEQAVAAFGAAYHAKCQQWRGRLEHLRQATRRIVAWGSGTKGTMFLNTAGSQSAIEYIVDINPRKHGKYVPGSGQLIVPPEFLREYQPDLVIVMNPIYAEEIGGLLRAMKVQAEVCAA